MSTPVRPRASTLDATSEARLLDAPSSFKRTIDLPPDPEDDNYSRDLDFDDFVVDDDQDVEMQRYLEQIYTGGSGEPGMREVDTGNPNQSTAWKMKHKLKGTEETGSQKHQKRSHDQPSPRGSGTPASYYAAPYSGRNLVESQSGMVSDEIGVDDSGMRGPADPPADSVLLGQLDDLDIALVLPEFSNPMLRESMNAHSTCPVSTYTGKGKGRSMD